MDPLGESCSELMHPTCGWPCQPSIGPLTNAAANVTLNTVTIAPPMSRALLVQGRITPSTMDAEVDPPIKGLPQRRADDDTDGVRTRRIRSDGRADRRWHRAHAAESFRDRCGGELGGAIGAVSRDGRTRGDKSPELDGRLPAHAEDLPGEGHDQSRDRDARRGEGAVRWNGRSHRAATGPPAAVDD